MNNVDIRFKMIYNVNVFNRVTMNSQIGSLQDMILKVKVWNKAQVVMTMWYLC